VKVSVSICIIIYQVVIDTLVALRARTHVYRETSAVALQTRVSITGCLEAKVLWFRYLQLYDNVLNTGLNLLQFKKPPIISRDQCFYWLVGLVQKKNRS